MASFLKRLFGSADKPTEPVAPGSPSSFEKPVIATVDDRSHIDSSAPTQSTESMADIFQQKQAELQAELESSAARRTSSDDDRLKTEPSARAQSDEVMAEFLKRKRAELSTNDGVTGRGSGVYINGGTITVGGDIVGGDRIVIVSDGTIDRLFEPLLNEVMEIEPETLRAEARQHMLEIRDQAKCYAPDLVVVGKALKWLQINTPSLAQKLRTVLSDACVPSPIRQLAVVLLNE